MVNRIYIWLSTGVAVLVLTSMAGAQDKSTASALQYRTSREAQQTIGRIPGQFPKAEREKPQDVALPEFKCHEPLFVRWSTTMVKGGSLWIALDRSRTSSGYDRLYIDSNADGNLKDEIPIEAYRTEQQHAYFGPLKVTFPGKNGPIAYHLNSRLCDHGTRAMLMTPAGWYEGTITVGQARMHCLLIDYNVNGTFDDRSVNFNECDRIQIGGKGDQNTRFVGNYIEVGGALYRLQVARDGAYVKVTAAEDVTLGNVRLPETISGFAAGGENGLFIAKPQKGTVSLPVGQYRIDHWAIERRDDSGINWKVQGSQFSDKGLFSVTEGEETELSIGEPISSTLDIQDRGGVHYFRHDLKGKLEEAIQITRNGERIPAPNLHIKNKDGRYDQTFSFRYG